MPEAIELRVRDVPGSGRVCASGVYARHTRVLGAIGRRQKTDLGTAVVPFAACVVWSAAGALAAGFTD